MFYVKAVISTAHQFVIDKWEAEWQVPKILVDEMLKCLTSVAEAKWQKVVLKKAKRSNNGHFGYIFLLDRARW